jgi:TRAP-type C4-dicarboxylate transport system permease small subunit
MKPSRLHPRHQRLLVAIACLIILGFVVYLFVTAYLYS